MNMTPEVGDLAPDFTLPTTKRDSFNLYEEASKGPILLYFHVAAFGINCTQFMKKLVERANEFSSRGIRLMPINPDSKETHLKWIERLESPFEHIIDVGQEVSKKYGAIVKESSTVKGFTNREFFLVGTDGRILFKWRAEKPSELPDITNILRSIDDVL